MHVASHVSLLHDSSFSPDLEKGKLQVAFGTGPLGMASATGPDTGTAPQVSDEAGTVCTVDTVVVAVAAAAAAAAGKALAVRCVVGESGNDTVTVDDI